MTGREQAIAQAAGVFAAALAELDDTDPRTAAEAAYVPGGPSIASLEARIRARRGGESWRGAA